MPRIRNWKDLKFVRPSVNEKYQHIDSLFSADVDWGLIETHLSDMLRIVLSIRAGKIAASTLLRRLGSYSRKNRLYNAFRELGQVVRTIFLLRYLSDANIRRTIQSATNKSEAFNGYTKWVDFGGNGIIAENSRDEQRKIIKYNHLVSNLLILHTMYGIGTVLKKTLKMKIYLQIPK
jgi:TnpA family transposase